MTERTVHHGKAIGGPLDGQEISSRFPSGLIAVNVARKTSGIYRLQPDGTFLYEEDNSFINDKDKLYQAGEQADFDIRSL